MTRENDVCMRSVHCVNMELFYAFVLRNQYYFCFLVICELLLVYLFSDRSSVRVVARSGMVAMSEARSWFLHGRWVHFVLLCAGRVR